MSAVVWDGWIEAASFPNAFVTAHDAVITNGQLKKGESVLVNAASGGVAWAALQIASLRASDGASSMLTTAVPSAGRCAKIEALMRA